MRNGLPETVEGWLAYQQQLHPQGIALGLDRLSQVWKRLNLPAKPAPWVLTVAGTNGKGSSVALLSAMLRASGRRVGTYTSPHLLDYRERIQLPAGLVSAEQLCRAFARVEQARAEVPLTVFECGTLAALVCFAEARLDAVVLEVGLGGRLDAVNLIDPDAALITTIGLDHQALLGDTLDAIGAEKAGILRPGIAAVYADQPAVRSVLQVAEQVGCALRRPGHDYRYHREGASLRYADAGGALDLGLGTGLRAPVQVHNAAACIALLRALQPDFPPSALQQGLLQAHIAARLQRLPTDPEAWLDVAHNPQAAASLVDWLREERRTPVIAVYGALGDKDVEGVTTRLAPWVHHWHLLDLSGVARGLSSTALAARLGADLPRTCHPDFATAWAAAGVQARAQELPVLVLGSFAVAECALRHLDAPPLRSMA